MRKKIPVFLAVILLVAGVLIFAYPMVSSFINKQHGSYAITEFQQQIDMTDEESLSTQRSMAEAYNEALLNGNAGENYEDILNIAGGMMGYISIPVIDVNLPIYHGVDEEVLAKGVGHMPESAFPIGGEGNHSVLTGHTGLPSAKLFTDLIKLQEGDMFYINILADKLAYQIDQIKVVLPSESKDLAAVSGKDYCTLVTCTPYGVNSHRLLVRGIRVEPHPEEAPVQTEISPVTLQTFLVMISVIIALIIAAGVTVLLIVKRKSGKG